MAVKKENSKSSATATAVKPNPNESKTCSDSSCYDAKTNERPTSKVKGNNASARIVIKYDVGFGNALFIRGEGANLSWDKGVALKNIANNEWVWETSETFTKCEFKILINDTHYETGPNHTITFGSSAQYTPHFPNH